MGGYTGTTYIFPDGTKKEYTLKKYRKISPNELKGHLPRIKGSSFDNKFPSNGCDYIEHFPERQHYHHGRFDFYLEQNGIAIEDDKTIQHFYQPETVLQLLSFSAQNPEDAVYRLIEEKKL